jgi:Na+/H+ antiporter NhaD/arsenite permease-like protein
MMQMEIAGIICLIIFVVTLVVLLIGKFDDTAVVLFSMGLAAAALYVFGGHVFNEMLTAISWDTILFIMAMMIIISVVGSSGMFQYVALVLAKRTRGDSRKVFLVFMSIVFIISPFIPPLPTIIIMATFTVEVCRGLGIDFRPFLIGEVIVADLASFPTPIGSIPNLLIVRLANLDVGIMFIVLMPLSVILFVTTILFLLRYYKDVLVPGKADETSELFMIDPRVMVKSRFDFYLSILTMAVLLAGLILVPNESAIVAVLVASALLVISFDRAKDLLQQLSWDTVFFVVGLLGLVASLQVTGVVGDMVTGLVGIVGANMYLAALLFIWIPGFALGLLDTTSVGALMAPLAKGFAIANPIIPTSLIAGVNIGGYAIPFGDAPNMLVVSLAEKNERPIRWGEFMKVGLLIGLMHLTIATIYMFVII